MLVLQIAKWVAFAVSAIDVLLTFYTATTASEIARGSGLDTDNKSVKKVLNWYNTITILSKVFVSAVIFSLKV